MMKIEVCGRGHHYDGEKYTACPFCTSRPGSGSADFVTEALRKDEIQKYALEYVQEHTGQKHTSHRHEEEDEIQKYALEYVKKHTMQKYASKKREAEDEEDDDWTVSLAEKFQEPECEVRRPVAGWLVCLTGKARGKDYPLYAGYNRIGRGAVNAVVLAWDQKIAENDHCSVVYDDKKNVFYLVPKQDSATYLDGVPAQKAVMIKTGQVIGAGESQLEFVAFCRGDRKW